MFRHLSTSRSAPGESLSVRRCSEWKVGNRDRRFLQLWQGLLTQRTTRILVLAATNLPQHLDAAAVRRFGVRIEVSAVPGPDVTPAAESCSSSKAACRVNSNSCVALKRSPMRRRALLSYRVRRCADSEAR